MKYGTALESRIRDLRQEREILIASHSVLGYPSFNFNRKAIAELVGAGVEIIELQFPFSEPIADGPVLMHANQEAVKAGTTTAACFDFTQEITSCYSFTLFLVMTYYNILYKFGIERFVERAAGSGVQGIIVPDLPPEESGSFVSVCGHYDVAPIFLVTPLTTQQRMERIASLSQGMLYCVARKGVTGYHTNFSLEFDEYLQRVRTTTTLPVGVGFGVRTAEDVAHLIGKADVAIICSQAIEVAVNQSPEAAGKFLKSIRR